MFTPVLAKHSKSFSLIDCISVGVPRAGYWNTIEDDSHWHLQILPQIVP